ncbi:helix-turn-helix domain-containing protein [Enterobacter cloacae subsp. dissolvens]
MIIITKDSFLKKGMEALSKNLDVNNLFVFDIGCRLYFFERSQLNKEPIHRTFLNFNHFSVDKSLPLSTLKSVLESSPWRESYHHRAKLSVREKQVIKLIAKGHSQKSISNILDIGEKAISYYKVNAMKKKRAKGLPSMIYTMKQWDNMIKSVVEKNS